MKGPNRWGVFDWIILKNQMLRGSEHLITHANYYAIGLAEIKANFARCFVHIQILLLSRVLL
jgi:hypothetical protein